MLKDILSEKEKNFICNRHFEALKLFGNIYTKTNVKSRHRFIYPLKKAGFSRIEALNFGFDAKKKMWMRCLNQSERNKGGRPKLDNSIIKKINDHLKENSSIAANRYLKLAKANVMYRHTTKTEAFNTFKKKFSEKVSFHTFKKYFEKKYKSPHRVIFLNFSIIIFLKFQKLSSQL